MATKKKAVTKPQNIEIPDDVKKEAADIIKDGYVEVYNDSDNIQVNDIKNLKMIMALPEKLVTYHDDDDSIVIQSFNRDKIIAAMNDPKNRRFYFGDASDMRWSELYTEKQVRELCDLDSDVYFEFCIRVERFGSNRTCTLHSDGTLEIGCQSHKLNVWKKGLKKIVEANVGRVNFEPHVPIIHNCNCSYCIQRGVDVNLKDTTGNRVYQLGLALLPLLEKKLESLKSNEINLNKKINDAVDKLIAKAEK